MNSECEVCDTRQATIYCMTCAKLHLFCKKCYDLSHECDPKKLHETKKISITTLGEEGLEEILLCQEHKKKFKEYSCLTCNQSICSDCIIRKHKEHEIDTIEKNYEKVIKNFNTSLSKYKEMLKLLDTNRTPIVNYLNKILDEIKSMKQKMMEDIQSLIKTIEEKAIEMMAIVDSEIESFSQDVKLLQKSTEEFKGMVEKCSESIKKMEVASHENCHKFFKNVRELEKIKELLNTWLPIASSAKDNYMLPQLEIVEKYMTNIKKTEAALVNFGNELKQSFDEHSIVRTFSHKMLLLSWISEACKTRRFSLKLLWKGLVDGFAAATFHNKCNNQGTTVTVVLSEFNCIFGGFTTKPWASNNVYVYDPQAFIFSLTHKTKLSRQKHTSNSIHCSSNHGPIFGGGNDICIYDNCNINNNYSSGNCTYDLPQGVDNNTYLAGAYNFKVKDIEVYSVTTH